MKAINTVPYSSEHPTFLACISTYSHTRKSVRIDIRGNRWARLNEDLKDIIKWKLLTGGLVVLKPIREKTTFRNTTSFSKFLFFLV